jgi:ABC-type multidrug transport system fused ATPase/permease subunit
MNQFGSNLLRNHLSTDESDLNSFKNQDSLLTREKYFIVFTNRTAPPPHHAHLHFLRRSVPPFPPRHYRHFKVSLALLPFLLSLFKYLYTNSSIPFLQLRYDYHSARGSLTGSPAIESRNVSYSITTTRGKFLPILKDCSISVPPGQLWMLLGPNGCGKSTLLKVVYVLLQISQ